MSDDLVSRLSGLALSEAPANIKSTLLSYSSWLIQPTTSLLEPGAILAGDVDLQKYLNPNVPAAHLPKLKDPIPLPMTIQSYMEKIPPVPKPNLLMVVATLFALHNVDDVKLGWNTLSSYDIIMPRKVLTTILANKFDDIETYAWRPTPDAPLLIDRKSSYSTNPGSIGMLFESRLVESRSDDFRFYGVFEVVLDGRLKIAVTGEVDAVEDESGAPIEVKTRPSWARSDAGREFDTCLQATVGCVKTIVTGGFTAQRGVRNGPVAFARSNLASQRVNEYYRADGRDRRCLAAGVKFLDAVIDGCKTSRRVYAVSCERSGQPNLILEDDLTHCTVSEELIEHVATMDWK